MYEQFTQADGRVLRLLAEGYKLIDPWDSMTTITMPLDGRSPDALSQKHLHVAHSGNYDYIIANKMNAEVVQRLSAQGGEFLVAASPDTRYQGIGLWRGKYYEVAAYMPQSTTDASVALGPLMNLNFADSAEGLVITPELSLGATVDVNLSTSYVSGVGEVDVRSAHHGLSLLPAWAGLKVEVGEMWKWQVSEEGNSDTDQRVVVASETAVLMINPRDHTAAGLVDAVNFAKSITELSIS